MQFWLHRKEDVSGISGTGRIAQGFEFEDGTVAMRWLTATGSTCVYASIEDVKTIHGHNGATDVVFEDGSVL